MLRTIIPSEMKRIENNAIRLALVSGQVLMHRAAAHVADAATRWLPPQAGRLFCACGTGNNGGDGLAAVRLLCTEDPSLQAEVWLLQGPLSPDAQRELTSLLTEAPQAKVYRASLKTETPANDACTGTPIFTLHSIDTTYNEGTAHVASSQAESTPRPFPSSAHCIIDALFGTGLSKPVEGTAAALCFAMNQASAGGTPVLSVDIPSGLDGKTGCVLGCAVTARQTITFHRPKLGLYLRQGPNQAGEVLVRSIGLPPQVDDAPGCPVAEAADIPLFFPPRARNTHKGSYGRVLVVAGSPGMAGAAAICATAALRAGAGLVTIACPKALLSTLQVLCPCATCLPLPANTKKAWKVLKSALPAADSIAVGPGMGTGKRSAKLLAKLLPWLTHHHKPAVVDADALSLLAKQQWQADTDFSPSFQKNHILTPHPAEAARLLNIPLQEVEENVLAAAEQLQQCYGASIVVKGATSVLACEQELALNVLGTPGMAKGGSGDALTGILAALQANAARGSFHATGIELLQAGCGQHGLAGRQAAKLHGERSMLVTDLCQQLGLIGQVQPTHEEAAPICISETSPCASAAPAPGSPLGRQVWVTVEHKLGSNHPEHGVYPLNCGYVSEVLQQENEWQDAYIIGVNHPVDIFQGEVIATLRQPGEAAGRWVVATPGTRMSEADIRRLTAFGEKADNVKIHCL